MSKPGRLSIKLGRTEQGAFMAQLERIPPENLVHGERQKQRITMAVALRDIGNGRRQRVLTYLANRFNIVSVPVKLPPVSRCLNLIRTASPRKSLWHIRSKRNSYYFKEASRALTEALHRRTGGFYDLTILFEALYAPYLVMRPSKPYLVYEDSTRAISLKAWPDWVPDTARTQEYCQLELEYYRGAARIVTSNERTRRSLISDYQIQPERVVTIGQGCDLSVEPWPEVKRVPELLMFVGYDFERKGGHCLIEAFRYVKKSHPAARLLIVGAKVQVEEPGVEVVAPVQDKATLIEMYRRASIFVLPAIYDPNPHAAMEAMSLETPVVVATGCGTSELIEDGENGFVVETGDSKLLANRLIRLLEDPQLAMRMGRAGARLLQTKYTWEQVSDRIYNVVLEILGERNKFD